MWGLIIVLWTPILTRFLEVFIVLSAIDVRRSHLLSLALLSADFVMPA